MGKINLVETNMEQERAVADEEMDQLEQQSKELAEKLEKLERDLEKQVLDHHAICRGWERKIEH